MAKVAFSKLKIKELKEVKTITFNDVDIEVKQYLPIQDKLTIIGNAINNGMDGNPFPNNLKLEILIDLEIVQAYTNLTFTDKMLEEPTKLYDMVATSGLLAAIKEAIPREELYVVEDNTIIVADNVYRYMNSAYGIMENIVKDYADTDMEASNIQKKLADPKNLTLLKDVMTKLG